MLVSQDKEQPPNVTLEDAVAGLSIIQDKGQPDSLDTLEKSKLDDDRLREDIENLRSDRKLREKYADAIMQFLQCYSISVGFFIVLSGFSAWGFTLPEPVLISLVGSTAIAAIGLVGFIAKGLFGNKNNRLDL